MVCMTFKEANQTFDKEVKFFENADKLYLFKANVFIFFANLYISEETEKRKADNEAVKEKYTKAQLEILESNIEFPDTFFRTVENQKMYKRSKDAISQEIKSTVACKMEEQIVSIIGKVLLHAIISKVRSNNLKEIKKIVSFVDTNFEYLIYLIRNPISKAIMHNEEFKLKAHYLEAIKILQEQIPSYNNDFEVLCKEEIKTYICENPDINQRIIEKLSKKGKDIYLEYFGLNDGFSKSFSDIAFIKDETISKVVNCFIREMKQAKYSLKVNK